jgi:hypothetical protein
MKTTRNGPAAQCRLPDASLPNGQHGGARPGAGRKPILAVEQQFSAGARCEQLLLEAITTKRQVDLAAHLAPHGIQENYEVAHSVPLRYRKLVIELGAKNRAAAIPENLPARVVDAIEAVRGNASSLDERHGRTPPLRRVYRPKAVRPREFRERIVAQVTREAAARYGVPVSSWSVQRAWKAFRKLQRSVKADLYGSPPAS